MQSRPCFSVIVENNDVALVTRPSSCCGTGIAEDVVRIRPVSSATHVSIFAELSCVYVGTGRAVPSSVFCSSGLVERLLPTLLLLLSVVCSFSSMTLPAWETLWLGTISSSSLFCFLGLARRLCCVWSHSESLLRRRLHRSGYGWARRTDRVPARCGHASHQLSVREKAGRHTSQGSGYRVR